VSGILWTVFNREIVSDPPRIEPRWLRIPAAVAYSGFSRAKLFTLLSERLIESVSVVSAGKRRGIRVVDRLSIDEFLSSLSKKQALRRQPANEAR
jgi:hypothetical protein